MLRSLTASSCSLKRFESEREGKPRRARDFVSSPIPARFAHPHRSARITYNLTHRLCLPNLDARLVTRLISRRRKSSPSPSQVMTTSPAEYLQSSFDPSKALVSQLRGILLAHDVRLLALVPRGTWGKGTG